MHECVGIVARGCAVFAACVRVCVQEGEGCEAGVWAGCDLRVVVVGLHLSAQAF